MTEAARSSLHPIGSSTGVATPISDNSSFFQRHRKLLLIIGIVAFTAIAMATGGIGVGAAMGFTIGIFAIAKTIGLVGGLVLALSSVISAIGFSILLQKKQEIVTPENVYFEAVKVKPVLQKTAQFSKTDYDDTRYTQTGKDYIRRIRMGVSGTGVNKITINGNPIALDKASITKYLKEKHRKTDAQIDDFFNTGSLDEAVWSLILDYIAAQIEDQLPDSLKGKGVGLEILVATGENNFSQHHEKFVSNNPINTSNKIYQPLTSYGTDRNSESPPLVNEMDITSEGNSISVQAKKYSLIITRKRTQIGKLRFIMDLSYNIDPKSGQIHRKMRNSYIETMNCSGADSAESVHSLQ